MISASIQKTLQSPTGEMLLDVTITLHEGSFVTLYGKSGAGKTSILRILAGLVVPEKGNIVVNGEEWLATDKGVFYPPQRRKVGFVFQDYALFPNMTIKENLAFALRKGQDKTDMKELMEIMELGDLQNRKPDTLSGGQQQRVALARALVQRPQLLMLDEPLSALDQEMRLKLQDYILQLHRRFGLTTIMVSHDTSEILKMSDSMIVLKDGKIVGQDTPSKVFSHQEISGNFQFTGEVINIDKEDVIYIVTILIGRELVKVVAEKSEVELLKTGDKVLVASKAFNPIIKKLDN